ncbi:2'-5' RNA ligase family protein [Sphingomonas sp. LB-2]|uniref:2'-5' RNA ligase family protein n=1 Tax=Sphingomonas caeni TaxID=2984949 RepID=UPI00223143AD|nr:2'-5' RNA ligase family protein [Sphingomonas caeni]MCW3846981.1 2'-5' RNA ligase family protein [Sphingomonas caeni]
MATRREPPLYLFAKPPAAKLRDLARLRALFGIESRYALDRLHSTLLPLGEAMPGKIEAARAILGGFHGEPFDVVFDHIEGATLKPRKGLRAPGIFQRALARHFAISGFALPDYSFGLHLNLDYPPASDRRASIAPLAWTIDEILLIESAFGRHILHGRRALAVRQYALAL